MPRLPIRRTATVVAVAIIAGGGAGVALAMTPSDDDEPAAPRSAEQVYDASMTLQEVAKAATGLPGEVAPPCPSEELVTKLKEAELEFGPCDPFPEDGAPIVLAQDPAPEEAPGEQSCPSVPGSKGYPDLTVTIPCAVGATIIDAVPVEGANGQMCMTLTYVASSTANRITERLCPGERPSVGGTAVGAPISGEAHNHDTHEH